MNVLSIPAVNPCFMCSGAMVWVKLGRLVYGASNIDLENILEIKAATVPKWYLITHSGTRKLQKAF